ncbi:hypothetical protein NUSPORA_02071 [Nucleospora cyclopteri]
MKIQIVEFKIKVRYRTKPIIYFILLLIVIVSFTILIHTKVLKKTLKIIESEESKPKGKKFPSEIHEEEPEPEPEPEPEAEEEIESEIEAEEEPEEEIEAEEEIEEEIEPEPETEIEAEEEPEEEPEEETEIEITESRLKRPKRIRKKVLKDKFIKVSLNKRYLSASDIDKILQQHSDDISSELSKKIAADLKTIVKKKKIFDYNKLLLNFYAVKIDGKSQYDCVKTEPFDITKDISFYFPTNDYFEHSQVFSYCFTIEILKSYISIPLLHSTKIFLEQLKQSKSSHFQQQLFKTNLIIVITSLRHFGYYELSKNVFIEIKKIAKKAKGKRINVGKLMVSLETAMTKSLILYQNK